MKLIGLRAMRLALCLAAMVTFAVPGFAADKVVVGMIGSFSDAPFFLAVKNGYFKDVNIEPQFEQLGSLTKQVAPLSAGRIDVASGAVSAGLYNAVTRDIPLRVVADKGRNAPGYGYNVIMVRKDLYENGTIKSFKDMKGHSIATIGSASADMSILNEMMKKGGLSYDDLKQTALTLPNHLIALENKGIDMTLTPEPFATIIEKKGLAVKFATVSSFYPNQQQLVLIYGADFMKKRHDVAERFMVAYLRGVRSYMDGLKDGKIAGPNADEVIAVTVANTHSKNPKLLKEISPVFVNVDGEVNMESMKKDWEFFKEKGLVKGDTTPEELVDMSFVKAALKKIGPYEAKK